MDRRIVRIYIKYMFLIVKVIFKKISFRLNNLSLAHPKV